MPRAAEREVRVSADASAVMQWLTDPVRREREWRSGVEAEPEIQEVNVVWLPNGGLRFETVHVREDLVAHHVIEDVAVGERTVDRVVRGRASRWWRRTRWIVNIRITVESLGNSTTIAVRTWGRPVGMSLAYLLVGREDVTAGRALTTEASRLTDFVVSGVTDRFA